MSKSHQQLPPLILEQTNGMALASIRSKTKENCLSGLEVKVSTSSASQIVCSLSSTYHALKINVGEGELLLSTIKTDVGKQAAIIFYRA